MKRPKAACILLAAAAMAAPMTVPAQTTRISCGVRSDGCASYRTVYEFDYVDEKPSMAREGQTLMKYINRERHYPAAAYAQGIEGRVMCSFVVNTDGSISNVTVIKGVEPSLNREAMRILSEMPEWRPGKIDGEKVPVRVVCAVPFRR